LGSEKEKKGVKREISGSLRRGRLRLEHRPIALPVHLAGEKMSDGGERGVQGENEDRGGVIKRQKRKARSQEGELSQGKGLERVPMKTQGRLAPGWNSKEEVRKRGDAGPIVLARGL